MKKVMELPKKFQRAQPEPLSPTNLSFEEKVHSRYYENLVTTPHNRETRQQYQMESNAAEATFMVEALAYTIKEGVPEKYAPKVLSHAWQEGHGNGYSEIYNCLCDLIEIFQ